MFILNFIQINQLYILLLVNFTAFPSGAVTGDVL